MHRFSITLDDELNAQLETYCHIYTLSKRKIAEEGIALWLRMNEAETDRPLFEKIAQTKEAKRVAKVAETQRHAREGKEATCGDN